MSRPDLLLDIDGVIAVFGPGAGEGTFLADAGGFPVQISLRTPQRVRALAARFNVVFCSSWMDGAPRHIAPILGLRPGVPFISFDVEDPSTGTWKLPSVRRHARDRPCAWVDDELGDDATRWACDRAAPTLLVECDPRTGLTDDAVDALTRFADGLPIGRRTRA